MYSSKNVFRSIFFCSIFFRRKYAQQNVNKCERTQAETLQSCLKNCLTYLSSDLKRHAARDCQMKTQPEIRQARADSAKLLCNKRLQELCVIDTFPWTPDRAHPTGFSVGACARHQASRWWRRLAARPLLGDPVGNLDFILAGRQLTHHTTLKHLMISWPFVCQPKKQVLKWCGSHPWNTLLSS